MPIMPTKPSAKRAGGVGTSATDIAGTSTANKMIPAQRRPLCVSTARTSDWDVFGSIFNCPLGP